MLRHRPPRQLLHAPVGLIPAHPVVNQREQNPLRKQRAVRQVEVRAHPLDVNHHSLDERDRAPLEVIQQRGGVGDDDPLD